jgi:hypothetical protein
MEREWLSYKRSNRVLSVEETHYAAVSQKFCRNIRGKQREMIQRNALVIELILPVAAINVDWMLMSLLMLDVAPKDNDLEWKLSSDLILSSGGTCVKKVLEDS